LGERNTENQIFALYARAKVAFQLGGELLPQARANARKALRLCSGLSDPSAEIRHLQRELLKYLRE